MKQKIKEILINTGIGFATFLLLILVMFTLTAKDMVPVFVFDVLRYGIFGLAFHQLGRFLKGLMK